MHRSTEQFEAMTNFHCDVLLTTAELRLSEKPAENSGAMVEFRGIVRRLEDGRRLEGIDYEAHPKMAEHQLAILAREAANHFGLHAVTIHHRVGFVAVGEASIFLRLTSENRSQAFSASIWLMDELKKRVPIWKRPRFAAAAQCDSAPVNRPYMTARQ